MDYAEPLILARKALNELEDHIIHGRIAKAAACADTAVNESIRLEASVKAIQRRRHEG